MAISDIFKKKRQIRLTDGQVPAIASSPAKPEAPVTRKAETRAVAARSEVGTSSEGSRRGERKIIGIIIAPHLTEKTTRASEGGWYAFRVSPSASKPVIRRAVEDRYGVAVERVRVLRSRPKTVRIGRIEGTSRGFKKAMVKIKAGQTIEFT